MFNLFRRSPPHCIRCGDQMEPHEYLRSYSSRNGAPQMIQGWRCPRSDDNRPLGLPAGLYNGYTIECMDPPPWANEAARRAYYEEHKPYTSVPNWRDEKWKAPVA